uniref:RPA_interact_N domain-containing protein n=1 Tax=Strongyloides venezuelensis TaxID=75913 RepID=A0A0K0F5L5_STRVS
MNRKNLKSPRLTEYKTRNAGWKDDIRKECFRKIRENRENRFNSFRNIKTINEEEAMETTGIDVIKGFLIENSIPENEDELIDMVKEIYEEVFLQEYEFYEEFKHQCMKYDINEYVKAMASENDIGRYVSCPNCPDGRVTLKKVSRYNVIASCKNCDFCHTFYNECISPDEDDVNELFQIAITKHYKTGCFKKAPIISIKGQDIRGKDSFLLIHCSECGYSDRFNFDFF